MKEEEEPPFPTYNNPSDSGSQTSREELARREAEEQELRRRLVARKSAQIDEIAARIEFSTIPVVLRQVKTGELLEPSAYPADAIDVRPMKSVTEMSRLLGSAHALNDEQFFGALAARRLPVMEHLEFVDVIEDVVGVPQNTLIILQDVSGSMDEHERAAWAVKLNQKLIERARVGKATVRMLTFNENIRSEVTANDDAGYNKLLKGLPQRLSPDGGTNINKPLSHALNVFGEEESRNRKLVLVTDGTESVDVETAKRRLTELSVELHVVCIGRDNSHLRAIADRYDLFPDQ
jgi:hypothetical protein